MKIVLTSLLICFISGYALTSSNADCKISLTSTPKLPLKNLVKNPQLKDGIKDWIVGKKSSSGTGYYDDKGVKCLILVGGKSTQN